MASPFTIRAGISQGRIIPQNYTPIDGDYCFVLGDDLPGQIESVSTYDYVQLLQTKDPADPDGAQIMTFALRIRPPETMPADCQWRLDYSLGTVAYSKIITPGDMTRDYLEQGVRTKDTGDMDLIFKLTLESLTFTLENFDVELPGVYLDGIVFPFGQTSFVVFNRDPEPGQIQVPSSGPIYITVADPSQEFLLDKNSIRVIVNGVVAWENYSVQNGFTGSSGPFEDGYFESINLTPPVPWGSKEIVTVEVQAAGHPASTMAPINLSYTFTAEDTEAPTIANVRGSGLKTVEVTFNEETTNGDATATDDALNPANYTIARNIVGNVPQVDVNIVSVEKISETVFQLTTDIELTPLGNYTLTVTDVADQWGNAIVDPGVSYAFTAAPLPKVITRNLNLYKMLGNIHRRRDRTGDLERFCNVLQEVLNLVLYDSDRFVESIDPDFCDASYLDALLYRMGNPFEFDLSVSVKRKLVGTLVDIYRRKGTKIGIISTVNFLLGLTITITGVIEGGWALGVSELGVDTIVGSDDLGETYSFDVESPIFLTDTQKQNIKFIVEYMKPAHTHMRMPIIEPDTSPGPYDPVELGISRLNEDFILH